MQAYLFLPKNKKIYVLIRSVGLWSSSCSQSRHYEVYKKRTLRLSSLDRVYSFFY
jgi:hypothetical protein